MAYTNSALVAHTHISPNRTVGRDHAIDTVTLHVIEGQITAERLGEIFGTTTRRASSNYCVDKDGRVGMFVEEKDRAWTSGSSANDHRAVTIEIASDTTPPYKVNDNVLDALVELLADICKRNGIPALLWKNDKSLVGRVDKQNMTVHRWFQSTSCPGEFMMGKMGEIASRVNAKLGVKEAEKTPSVTFKKGDIVSIRSGAKYYTGADIPDWVEQQKWYVLSVSGERVVLGDNETKTNNIESPVAAKDLVLAAPTVSASSKPVTAPSAASGSTIKKGSLVRVKAGAKYYGASTRVPKWVTDQAWYVLSVSGNRVVIDQNEKKTNSIESAVNKSDCILVR